MNASSRLVVILLAAGCAGTQTGGRTSTGAGAEVSALSLSDTFVAARVDTFPEWGTFLGYPRADNARLGDNSLAALARWQEREDDFLARARALPGFTPGSREWLAKGILLEVLESSIEIRACREELWSVGSFAGWQSWLQQVAAIQPVGSEKTRADAVHRVHQFASYVDNEAANQREGLRLGFVANRQNAQRMLEELDGLLALPPERWPFLQPADRDPNPAFRASLVAIMRDELVPATRRYRDFLAGEYLPRARASFGLAGVKDSAACYRAAIRRGTTQDLSPADLQALGMQRLESLRAEMIAAGEKAFGTRDLARIRRALDQPASPPPSPEELLARARAMMERARLALPRAFHRLPRGKLVVLPIPEFQAKGGAIAHYNGSMKDGAFEGTFWFNPMLPARPEDEALAFHEGIPGHHLQLALVAEGGTGPDIARYVLNIPYTEGWALYAERLADELGLYSSDLHREGMLVSESFRAARLVVDTGIHSMGWSREQALEFMLRNVGDNPLLYGAEVDRYASWPGQALGYMVGALEIRRLRDEARQKLGPRFELAAFHDLVLEAGAIPLPMLRERVRLWIQENSR